MKIKIQHQLTFTYILVILLTITLTGTLFLHWLKNYLITNTENNLRSQSHSLAKMLTGYAWNERDLNQAAFFFTETFESRKGFVFRIFDTNGNLIASSEKEEEAFIKEEMQESLNKGSEVRWFENFEGEKLIHITVPVERRNKIIGFVDTSTSLREIENIYFMLIRMLGLATLWAVIAVSIIGFFLAKTVTEPINKIKNIAVKISAGNFEEKIIPVKNPSELNELSVTINYMAEQLNSFINEITDEKNKINGILKNVIDGLIAIDLNKRVIFLNSTAEKRFSQGNVTGTSLQDLWPNEEMIAITEEVIKSNSIIKKEISISQVPLEILDFTVAPFKDEKGKNTGIIIVFRDITELRLLEKVRTDFFSNVSHELKTPLTIIKGFCITLLDDPGSKEEMDHALNTIEQETERLTRLVNDILELSKLRNKKINFKIEILSLKDIITQIEKQFRKHLKKYNMTLTCEGFEDLPAIKGDRDKIKQVFINLIDNSIKYTGIEQKIALKARVLENKLYITIIDSGPGIAEEDIPYIFERFFRSKKDRERDGTGLGLPIVKEIIEAHGGEISVKNIQPHGLEITFYIPILN